MVDLATIPDAELHQDHRECVEDIQWCECGLSMGIETCWGDFSVQERLDGNLRQLAVIKGEIKRRQAVASGPLAVPA